MILRLNVDLLVAPLVWRRRCRNGSCGQKILDFGQVSAAFRPWRDNDRFWYGDAQDSGNVGNIGPRSSRKRLAGLGDSLEPTGVDQVREGTAVPFSRQDDVKAVRNDWFHGGLGRQGRALRAI